MKVYIFKNEKDEIEYVIKANDRDFKEKIETFFNKKIDSINKELSEFNCIFKGGKTFTISVIFLDFSE